MNEGEMVDYFVQRLMYSVPKTLEQSLLELMQEIYHNAYDDTNVKCLVLAYLKFNPFKGDAE